MDSVSPVLTTAEVPCEQVIALDQPEYLPIIVARVVCEDNVACTFTRFQFNDAERALIAAGADLVLGQPHHGFWMPVSLQLAKPGEYPVEE